MKLQPSYDRVVIRRVDGDLKSKGWIIIPDTTKVAGPDLATKAALDTESSD